MKSPFGLLVLIAAFASIMASLFVHLLLWWLVVCLFRGSDTGTLLPTLFWFCLIALPGDLMYLCASYRRPPPTPDGNDYSWVYRRISTGNCLLWVSIAVTSGIYLTGGMLPDKRLAVALLTVWVVCVEGTSLWIVAGVKQFGIGKEGRPDGEG